MKLLVPVKRVVDYKVKVRVKADGSGVEPAKRSAGIRVADVAELVNKLRNEAKVV